MTTFLQLKNLMADEIGDDATDVATTNGRYLNMAARDAWNAYNWPEARARDFKIMTAEYSTGTITTDGTTGIEGSGTTFTAGMVGRKFALGYNKTWYEIATFTDADTIVLADAYAGTDVAGSTYVIYDDTITLPSDVAVLTRVILHDSSRSYELPITNGNQRTGVGTYPLSAGRPRWATLEPNASGGERVVRLGPYAPDQTYRIQVEYLKAYTEMSADGDTHGLAEALTDTILMGALAHAYRRDHFARSQIMATEFRRRLREDWSRLSEVNPHIFQIAERGRDRSGGPDDWPVNLDSLEL